MKRFICITCACVAFSLVFSSCKKNEVEAPLPTPTQTETLAPTETPTPTEDLTNKAINPLTGLYIDKEASSKRPIALVISNIHKAKPQSGISQADIIYEVLAEGDITRLVAIFRDFNSEKIGPIRSARDYFIDFAIDNDAIFVHHGGSPGAYSHIKKQGINNIDGMKDGVTFWRDKTRKSQAGMYEHSSYTSAKNIKSTLETLKIRQDIFEDQAAPFKFYDTPQKPNASQKDVSQFKVTYSTNYVRNFTYNPLTLMYAVFQGEDAHIDEETGKQLEVTNVLVQFVKMHVIAGDSAGRREIDTIGKGTGILFTQGGAQNVIWEKKSYKDPTTWTDENGETITLNKGKTWINVYQGTFE